MTYLLRIQKEANDREWKIRNRETMIKHQKETCSLLKNRRLRLKALNMKKPKSNRELSGERIISLKTENGKIHPNVDHVKICDLISSCTRKELDELFDLGNWNYLENNITPEEWRDLHNLISLREEMFQDEEYERRKSSWNKFGDR